MTMDELQAKLLELQQLDQEIEAAEARLAEFEPRLQTLGQPVSALEREVEDASARLHTLQTDARRLEKAANDKRDRLRAYEERLQRVRTQREEGAARTEMDLIRRAVEADEQEALQTMEQATRTDLKVDDLLKRLETQRAALEPAREEMELERQAAADEAAVLRERRANLAGRIEQRPLRLYERVRGGRAAVVLAPLTEEGACGHCFNILPVQEQSQVRGGGELNRCEACGVILYAAD